MYVSRGLLYVSFQNDQVRSTTPSGVSGNLSRSEGCDVELSGSCREGGGPVCPKSGRPLRVSGTVVLLDNPTLEV